MKIINKEGFMLYKSYYQPLKKLSDKELGRLFRFIFIYQIKGEVPKEEGTKVIMAFEFIINQFRLDEAKYIKMTKVRSEMGRRGGLASAKTRWGYEITKGNQNKQKVKTVSKVTVKDKEKEKGITKTKHTGEKPSREILMDFAEKVSMKGGPYG